jgi:hypothetical protein
MDELNSNQKYKRKNRKYSQQSHPSPASSAKPRSGCRNPVSVLLAQTARRVAAYHVVSWCKITGNFEAWTPALL